MKKANKENRNIIYERLGIITFGILVLGFVDVIVIEMIYKPFSVKYGIALSAFEMQLPILGGDGRILWWHIAFVPLGFILFFLASVPRRDWRLMLGGLVLFVTGLEDVVYYMIQLKYVPVDLPWLDKSPPIAWSCAIIGSEHVTRTGLFIATIIGMVFTGVIIELHKLWNRK